MDTKNMKESDITADEILSVSDETYAGVQRLLNYCRVAELEHTPGIILVLPNTEKRTANGVALGVQVGFGGTSPLVKTMLTQLFKALMEDGMKQEILSCYFEAMAATSNATAELAPLLNEILALKRAGQQPSEALAKKFRDVVMAGLRSHG